MQMRDRLMQHEAPSAEERSAVAVQALYGPAPYGARNAVRLLAVAAVLLLVACAGAVALAPT
jgi:hypothetical protein